MSTPNEKKETSILPVLALLVAALVAEFFLGTHGWCAK